MTRNKRTSTARKDATTAPLVRWQKPWNCMQMGTQLARRFPECARSTIAAAAAAAAVSSAAMICRATHHERTCTQRLISVVRF